MADSEIMFIGAILVFVILLVVEIADRQCDKALAAMLGRMEKRVQHMEWNLGKAGNDAVKKMIAELQRQGLLEPKIGTSEESSLT